jgi:hypothetical protein
MSRKTQRKQAEVPKGPAVRKFRLKENAGRAAVRIAEGPNHEGIKVIEPGQVYATTRDMCKKDLNKWEEVTHTNAKPIASEDMTPLVKDDLPEVVDVPNPPTPMNPKKSRVHPIEMEDTPEDDHVDLEDTESKIETSDEEEESEESEDEEVFEASDENEDEEESEDEKEKPKAKVKMKTAPKTKAKKK